MSTSRPWYVYILRCSDDSLYTGITVDPDRRLAEHREGTASRYTRPRRPVRRVYLEQVKDRSAALKREYAIKQWPRPRKEKLVRSGSPRHHSK